MRFDALTFLESLVDTDRASAPGLTAAVCPPSEWERRAAKCLSTIVQPELRAALREVFEETLASLMEDGYHHNAAGEHACGLMQAVMRRRGIVSVCRQRRHRSD